MKKLFLFAALLLLVTSCAVQQGVAECVMGEPYGFWSGIWHGMIAPISFFISLFNDNVAVYAVNNNGGWYDFGFVLGAGILTVGGSSASSKRK